MIGVSGAGVAHGKSHSVAHRHINLVQARAAPGGAASWPLIANRYGLVIQSGGCTVCPAEVIAGRGHGITGSDIGEPGMDTVDAAIPMNPSHGQCLDRRRVARSISVPSDAILCKEQSETGWARVWFGDSASSTARTSLLRCLIGPPASRHWSRTRALAG